MAESKIYNFRLPEEVDVLLDQMAHVFETSRSDVVRQALYMAAGVLGLAQRDSFENVAVLRERYGADAVVMVWATEAEDGHPIGHVTVNGEAAPDVRAITWEARGTDKAAIFLDVTRGDNGEEPSLARFGSDSFILTLAARFPVGVITWPPAPRRQEVIQLRLADVSHLSDTPAAAKERIEA